MDQEQRFQTTLGGGVHYRIVGQHLEFLDGDGVMVARFDAVTPK